MKELTRTLIFVGVALILLTAAAVATLRPGWRGAEATFRELGEKFFPTFEDPLAATSLEVIDYDASTATPLPFKVMLKDGRWLIPSHHDYPADAKDRLSKTAAGVIDLRKDTIRSDRAEDHEALGVIDPLDTKTSTLQGRGKRVTLRDKSGEVLAEFIIGKENPDRSGQRFVRVPAQKRTYGVNVNVDLSTKFDDWIETNLLQLDSSRLRRIVFDNHKVDPEAGQIIPGEVLTIERKDASGPWTLADLAPDRELNTEKLTALTGALADLKIVGVRPKPPGLTRDLKTTGAISVTTQAALSLQSKGFYPLRDGRLLSNEGDILAATDEGVVYTLRYGEVTFARGEALSAGTPEEASAKGAGEPEKKTEGSTESRYLFVTVGFDPSLIPPPPPEPKAEGPLALPENVFEPKPEERAAQEKAAQEKADREQVEQERKITEGQKRVQELNDRFAGWYYVTPGDSYRSIVLNREALTRPKGEKPDPAAGGMSPDLFGPGGLGPRMPGLPPGHP